MSFSTEVRHYAQCDQCHTRETTSVKDSTPENWHSTSLYVDGKTMVFEGRMLCKGCYTKLAEYLYGPGKSTA